MRSINLKTSENSISAERNDSFHTALSRSSDAESVAKIDIDVGDDYAEQEFKRFLEVQARTAPVLFTWESSKTISFYFEASEVNPVIKSVDKRVPVSAKRMGIKFVGFPHPIEMTPDSSDEKTFSIILEMPRQLLLYHYEALISDGRKVILLDEDEPYQVVEDLPKNYMDLGEPSFSYKFKQGSVEEFNSLKRGKMDLSEFDCRQVDDWSKWKAESDEKQRKTHVPVPALPDHISENFCFVQEAPPGDHQERPETREPMLNRVVLVETGTELKCSEMTTRYRDSVITTVYYFTET